MVKLVSLLLALPCLVRAQGGPGSRCSDTQVEAYMRCVRDNPCLCANCDANPMDDTPEIVLPEPPQSCQDVNRLFCPLIRCCSACEAVAAEWYACAFADFAESQLGTDCPQVCSAFDYQDVKGDCQPTPVPATTAPPSAAPVATSQVLAASGAAGGSAHASLSSLLATGAVLLVAASSI